jgi:hypothetical protein
VAELARELRAARERAGTPAYRELAKKAHRSASVLADAASGRRCPTWEVTKSFLSACGADSEALQALWTEADESDRARRLAPRRPPQPKLATVRRLHRQPSGRPPSADPRLARGPNPWDAGTPAEYVHQLRALRAWAGQPGFSEFKHGRYSGTIYVGRSAVYDALSPKRTRLPRLELVRVIVDACGADVEEWVSAWRALRLREFEKANPSSIFSDQQVSPADQGQDGIVRPLKRPGR